MLVYLRGMMKHFWESHRLTKIQTFSGPMQEMWVPSRGQDDALEKRMATDSSILAWETPWTEEPGGLQSIGWQRVRHD